MAYGPRSYLVEQALISACANSDSMDDAGFGGEGTYSKFGTQGVYLAALPAMRASFETATESPENSGNFNCLVEVEAISRCDFSNDSTYIDQTISHLKLAGGMERWITTELAPADLETTDFQISLTGFTNTLKCHSIRLMQFERGVDQAESIMFHRWNLEVYLHEDTS